jgi:hypothetical protein
MEAKDRRNYPGINIKDIKGCTVPFVFNNAITHPGSQDYNYTVSTQPEGFFITPLGSGKIEVQLFGQADGETFVIDAAEVTAYTGKQLPYRCKKVVSGANTTVVSIQIVW